MRKQAASVVLASFLTLTLVACQDAAAGLPGKAQSPAGFLDQEIRELEAQAQAAMSRLHPVAPGIWVDVRPDGASVRLSPPLFASESVSKFERYVESLDPRSIARDDSALETITQQLKGALASARLQWSLLQGLTEAQRRYLMEKVVQPNLERARESSVGQPGAGTLAKGWLCTAATAGTTTAGPGAKAYARGSCANAYNNAYARALAGGQVDQMSDEHYNGAYASAVEYGKWSCSSYGAASGYVEIFGARITVDSVSSAYSGCQ